ncbi:MULTISPECIES: ABC transporter ATP-binding protein [unclassified Granulicatella]|uniref:ABC transporter ATP-binding protein n=1 Tax=unclassified Granulicatella TaxID=2630493 RepID=UPI0010733B19|nr:MULTISPECIES: ABC transporter ATP-binding protein [unclassified Granulicatella]MBF0780325.1 ABC transporter ATP-binding protein [Granulicatella sp. 19428wC4_WM01]TFU95552.1 ABC transporter ATP-binding protein [Granulicatella sp. WM01]
MLEVSQLSKSFGTFKALDNMSFCIKPGMILGLIGKNGAGKSTTFRLILDFITADTGEVLWNGQPLTKDQYNEIGYLPEERGLSLKKTVEEQIMYFAALKGKRKQDISLDIDEWMARFEVKGKRKDKIKTLSKGNQQKVQIITTLIHKPKLVILDEPFSGLDPVNTTILKHAILSLKEQGACVIFSSHNMENVEELCDELIMLNNGKIVLNGKVQEIKEQFGRKTIFLESKHTIEELQHIQGVTKIVPAKHSGLNITLEDEQAGKRVFDYVTKDGYIHTFSQHPLTLEDIFKLKAVNENE